MLRNWAETLGRNYNFRAKLPDRYNGRPIMLSTGNRLSTLKRGEERFSADLLRLADRFVEDENASVWDIGANMGVFALAAAHRAPRGSVLAVEPDLFNLMLLERTAAFKENAELPIRILPAAVSNEVGIGHFLVSSRSRSASTLAGASESKQFGATLQRRFVFTVTLDWIMSKFGKPDFIKCDVEGAELSVLQGATELLAHARPIMQIEIGAKSRSACMGILDRAGYEIFDPREAIDVSRPAHGKTGIIDFLMIPREKVECFAGR